MYNLRVLQIKANVLGVRWSFISFDVSFDAIAKEWKHTFYSTKKLSADRRIIFSWPLFNANLNEAKFFYNIG